VVLSIITEDKGVRQIFTGPDGFLSGEVAGKLFIEMSTLQPATHRELAPLVKAKGARLVDSPVMGSIPTVREGKLLALLGGEGADVERARRVLDHLTRRVAHIGPNGAGCAMKLAVNLGMALYLQSLAEAMSLGQSEGLTLEQMLDIFAEAPTASPWLKGKVGALKGEPSDITLDIRTMRKDVMSAIATGARNGVAMPATSGTLASLSAAVAGGWGDKDLAEVPRYFREFMLQVYD
jgi:3-hydroxyisobutyrate dehydrogenase